MTKIKRKNLSKKSLHEKIFFGLIILILLLSSLNMAKAKGWLLDIMMCVDKLGRKDFSLDDVYTFEKELNKKHPDNRHIKDKIRQQLQVLRDKGYLEFTSRGNYRLR